MENNDNNQNGDINLYLKEAFSKLGKKQTEIIDDLKVSQSYVSALMAGKKTVGKVMAEKLADLYGFDEGAILTGKNKIAIEEVPDEEDEDEEEDELALFLREERKNYDLTLTDVHEKTGIPQKLLKEFQWGEAQLTDRQRYALTQYVEEAREYFQENAIGIPKGRITGYYYPEVNASAGFDVSTFNEEKTRIPIFLPDFGDNVIFINVYGDSMYPKYKSGDMIGIKPVEFQYIVFGHPYVVVFDNGDTNIKYVQKGSDEHHVILASENPKYEPREYPLSIIRFFFTVKGSFNKERM